MLLVKGFAIGIHIHFRANTICIAFVLAVTYNLDVCAADVSTAFLYGKTKEKVFVIAGPEFGEHAGKRMIIQPPKQDG